MEGTPVVKMTSSESFDHEQAMEDALETAMNEIEHRLGKTVGEALAIERIAVTTELLTEVENRANNKDRFVAEVYAGMKRLAELELNFQVTKQKLDALYQ